MKRTVAALFISAFASTSFAQPSNGTNEPVASPQDCPAGTTTVHPNYKWQHGRFVRDGWVCQAIHPRS